MKSDALAGREAVFRAIDREKRRDRLLRRTSVVAWSLTILILLLFAAYMLMRIVRVQRLVEVGVALPGATYDAALPLLIVIGLFALLVATLSTIGIFLRLRTASLSEIQHRLASLEEMVRAQHADRGDIRSGL